MSSLDNGVIRLGIDLNAGGAITYLSKSGTGQNLVNSYDLGRQIQMSYYSGPVPFQPERSTLHPHWTFIGWNPIQVGDVYGHASKILESQNDTKRIHVQCIPMHWPLENVPGECTFDSWLELDGPVVHARCRLTNNRPDHTLYPARNQELPAIYTNGPWYRLMTYIGDQPFTDAPLTRIIHPIGAKTPWESFVASESWAALVDDHDFGLGVWIPGICQFNGGFAGKPGAGGPHDGPTGYMSPQSREIIDWNIVHEYRYDLIVGSLAEIRKYARDHAGSVKPQWTFENDRQGWHYVNATDTGWPIKGELNVVIEQNDPQLIGPVGFWQASDWTECIIEMACHSTRSDARLYWRKSGDKVFTDAASAPCSLKTDGEYHTCRISLKDSPQWTGAIVQFRFDPVSRGAPGEWCKIKSIRLTRPSTDAAQNQP